MGIIGVLSGGWPMSSTVALLDKLLGDAGNLECKEHVIEQASYAVKDVKHKLLARFDEMVAEIAGHLGNPEFNANTESGEQGKNPMPAWVTGTMQADIARRVLRLSYWKREHGISY